MIGPVRGGRDRGHRQRAGVRCQDRLGGRLAVEHAENRPLQVEVLDGRLDRDVGRGGDSVERQRRAQGREPTLDPVVDRIRVEFELRRAPAQAGSNPLNPSLEGILVDVVEHDLVTRLERDLGDPRAHGSGAHDTDDGSGEIVGPVRFVHVVTVRQTTSGPTTPVGGRLSNGIEASPIVS